MPPWSAAEFEELQRLVAKDGAGDWEQKAIALGTGRSGAALSQKLSRWNREQGSSSAEASPAATSSAAAAAAASATAAAAAARAAAATAAAHAAAAPWKAPTVNNPRAALSGAPKDTEAQSKDSSAEAGAEKEPEAQTEKDQAGVGVEGGYDSGGEQSWRELLSDSSLGRSGRPSHSNSEPTAALLRRMEAEGWTCEQQVSRTLFFPPGVTKENGYKCNSTLDKDGTSSPTTASWTSASASTSASFGALCGTRAYFGTIGAVVRHLRKAHGLLPSTEKEPQNEKEGPWFKHAAAARKVTGKPLWPKAKADPGPRKDYTPGVPQKWTAEEHELFLEAIKLYHRDWKRVTAHIGTRTVPQVRSHMQKFDMHVKQGLIPGWTEQDLPPSQKQKPPIRKDVREALRAVVDAVVASQGAEGAEELAAEERRSAVARARSDSAPWSSAEDEELRWLVEHEGEGNWKEKAAVFSTGRSRDALGARWRQHLKQPGRPRPPVKNPRAAWSMGPAKANQDMTPKDLKSREPPGPVMENGLRLVPAPRLGARLPAPAPAPAPERWVSFDEKVSVIGILWDNQGDEDNIAMTVRTVQVGSEAEKAGISVGMRLVSLKLPACPNFGAVSGALDYAAMLVRRSPPIP